MSKRTRVNMEWDEDLEIKLMPLSIPELLSQETIISILCEKGVNTYGFDQKSKEDLVSEYYKYACPLPQRKYRNNRKGREMTKSQIRVSKRKRKFDQMNESDPDQSSSYTIASSVGNQVQTNLPKSGFINQFDFLEISGNRLKPPPVVIDVNKKVVKLGGNKDSSINNSSSDNKFNNTVKHDEGTICKSTNTVKLSTKSGLDHIVINSNFKKKFDNKTEEVTSEKNKSNQSVTKEAVMEKSPSQPGTKIKLKRRSDIFIPSSEEILGNSNDNIKDSKESCAEKHSNETTTKTNSNPKAASSVKSPIRYSASITHSKQRQINLINDVIKNRASEDHTPVEESLPKKETEEGVVRKKFKTTSITWP